MRPNKLASLVERGLSRLNRIAVTVAAASLVVMMMLTVADTILRYVFNQPILGAFELTEFMIILLVFFGLAYTQQTKGHVSIDLVADRLPRTAQGIMGLITSLLATGFISLMVWRQIVYAERLSNMNQVSRELGLPISPFVVCAAVGTAVFCLALLVDVVYSARAVKK